MLTDKGQLQLLAVEANRGYDLRPIPSPRDGEIDALLDSEAAADLARLVTEEHWPVLRVYAERMASLAVRSNDTAALRRGLTALAMGGLADQEPDAMTILPLFQDAAMRIGASAAELFDAVGQAMGGSVETTLVEFQQRSVGDQAISAMGYRAAQDSEGFRYQRDW